MLLLLRVALPNAHFTVSSIFMNTEEKEKKKQAREGMYCFVDHIRRLLKEYRSSRIGSSLSFSLSVCRSLAHILLRASSSSFSFAAPHLLYTPQLSPFFHHQKLRLGGTAGARSFPLSLLLLSQRGKAALFDDFNTQHYIGGARQAHTYT